MRTSPFFVPRTRDGAQPSIQSMVKKREARSKQGCGEVSFLEHIPLSITKTNPFFQSMCDAITIVGPGYKCPTYEELWGPILQAEKNDINTRLEDLKKSWEATDAQ
jgi:hypothetical protein